MASMVWDRVISVSSVSAFGCWPGRSYRAVLARECFPKPCRARPSAPCPADFPGNSAFSFSNCITSSIRRSRKSQVACVSGDVVAQPVQHRRAIDRRQAWRAWCTSSDRVEVSPSAVQIASAVPQIALRPVGGMAAAGKTAWCRAAPVRGRQVPAAAGPPRRSGRESAGRTGPSPPAARTISASPRAMIGQRQIDAAAREQRPRQRRRHPRIGQRGAQGRARTSRRRAHGQCRVQNPAFRCLSVDPLRPLSASVDKPPSLCYRAAGLHIIVQL